MLVLAVISSQSLTMGADVHERGVEMSRSKAIWMNAIPSPDPSTMTSIESALIRMSTKGHSVNCELIQNELASLATFLRIGKESHLYPDIFAWGKSACPNWDPYCEILVGDAHYAQGDFERAFGSYVLALEGLESNEQPHLTANLNAGASLVSLGRFAEAIKFFQRVIDHPYEGADDFKSIAAINLSAAQLKAEFLSDAASTIRRLSVENLPEYWRGIHFSNALIVHQKLGDYAGSDSIWQNHLSQIPFSSLPPAIHPRILSELLQKGDFLAFSEFKEHVIQLQHSPLLEATHSHHPLFEREEHDQESVNLWELYRKFEEGQRTAHLVFLNETQPQLQNEMRLLQQELGRALEVTRNWKLTSAFIACALLILALVILLVRSQRLRRHMTHLAKIEPNDLLFEPQVDEEDLVILAQALTYGKGLQKALLIVRRLRAEFAVQSDSRLNLENIEMYGQLNDREKEVAGYIASGFNSKEIAQMLHVTTQHIYNVRSRIREKVGVPDDQDLLNWLRTAREVSHRSDAQES